MRSQAIVLALLLAGLSGCQCCLLTDHYADTVDCIATQNHYWDRFYCPGLDLNRIGRPDWCSYPGNRLLCGCACNRMRPPPCGHALSRQSRDLMQNQLYYPDWSRETPATELLPEAAPEEQQPGMPPMQETDEAEKDLQLP